MKKIAKLRRAANAVRNARRELTRHSARTGADRAWSAVFADVSENSVTFVTMGELAARGRELIRVGSIDEARSLVKEVYTL